MKINPLVSGKKEDLRTVSVEGLKFKVACVLNVR